MPKDTFYNLAEEKQEKVMRSAIDEFINNGYERGNVGNIAKNAGVAKGSMYQYFENKNELFTFSVKWAVSYIMKKYGDQIISDDKDLNIFDYYLKNSKDMLLQMREERKLVTFIQDVFLGKYPGITDESLSYMMKISDEYVIKLIKNGKESGYIRRDIDDKILQMFMTGATIKIKEYIMGKARDEGHDIVDMEYETMESDIAAMMDLLKNGMGAR